MGLLIKLAATAAALWVAVALIGGLEFEGTIWAFLGVSALIVVANAVVKPILNILSLPIVILTMGLFLLITNALVLQLVIWLSSPDRLNLGLTSTGFFWATLLGAIVISLVRAVVESVIDRD